MIGKTSLKGHASMLGANVMWGLMSPFAKLVMLGGTVTPLVVTDLRIFGAMILFWTTSFFQKSEPVDPKDMVRLFGASLLGIVFNQGCFIFGVGLTTPGEASIITTSMPLWVMILAAFILKEPVTGKKLMGIAAGAGGALLLILGSRHSTTSGNSGIWGDLLVLTAQLSYAFYIVLYKNFVSRYSLVTIMKWMFTYAFICALPFSARDLMNTDWLALDSVEIGSLAFIVVGATFGSYLLVTIGQKRLRPTVTGMYNYIQPIIACIVAISLGLDSFNLTKAFAILLIFSGVYLVTASKSRAELEKEEKNGKEEEKEEAEEEKEEAEEG